MKNFKRIIDNLLSQDECDELIKRCEELGFELSSIRTAKGEVIREDIRNNGRVIINDESFANELLGRFRDQLPEEVDGWKLKGLNEQLKVYSYTAGQQFQMHRDAPYIRNENERSFFTMLIYLNEDFEGGETFFLSGSVEPKTGTCCVFWQNQLHAGVKVNGGTKYAIRTDVMYTK